MSITCKCVCERERQRGIHYTAVICFQTLSQRKRSFKVSLPSIDQTGSLCMCELLKAVGTSCVKQKYCIIERLCELQ